MLRSMSLSLAVLALLGCSSPPVTPPTTPVAELSAASLELGNAPCGAASSKTLTLKNTGTGELTFTAAATGAFSVAPASGTVAAGDSATLTVTVTVEASATAGAALDGVLSVTTNAASGKQDVPLSATASGVTLTLTPTVASFGVLPVGTAAPALPLTLTNTGNVPATIDLAQPADAQFSLAWTGAPAAVTVMPGGAVAGLSAGFTPGGITPSSASAGITVAEAVCGVSAGAIPMTGQGTNGVVGLSAAELFFGTNGRVDCGTQAASKTLTLTNSGNLAYAWTATLAKGSASAFTVTPESGTVPANGGMVTLTIATQAIPAEASTAQDAFGDTLTVVTDAANDVAHPVALHQTANGAVLSFAPALVDFGQVPVDNTSSAPFTVVNDGNTSPMVTLTPDNAKFTLSATGPLAAPGGMATPVTGTFAPGASVTPETGLVALSLDPAEPLCAPLPAPLQVTGQGTSGAVSYSPAAVDFGAVNCGAAAAPATITFRNDGNQAYTVTPSLGRDAGSAFVVAMQPTDGVVVPDGGTVELTVTPAAIPQTSAVTPNLYGDVLTVTTDVLADVPHDIPLRMTARGSIFSISTASLDFGSVTSGATASAQFTVGNSGNAAGSLVFTPGQPAVFSLPSNASIAPNTATGEAGQFTPAGVMTYSDTATIAAGAGTVLCQPLPSTSMALSGVGSAGNVLLLSAASLEFGLVPCGTTASARSFTVTNTSGQMLTLAYALAGGASSPFTVSGPATVAAGASVTVTVTPAAIPSTSSTAPDAFGDSLSISATGGPVNEARVVPLHQTAQGVVLTIEPGSLHFTAANGNTQTKNFTVSNSGNVSAAYTLAVGGTNASSFSVTPTSATASGGGSVTHAATFIGPLLGGARSANVSLTTSATRCAPLPANLPLSGN